MIAFVVFNTFILETGVRPDCYRDPTGYEKRSEMIAFVVFNTFNLETGVRPDCYRDPTGYEINIDQIRLMIIYVSNFGGLLSA